MVLQHHTKKIWISKVLTSCWFNYTMTMEDNDLETTNARCEFTRNGQHDIEKEATKSNVDLNMIVAAKCTLVKQR